MEYTNREIVDYEDMEWLDSPDEADFTPVLLPTLDFELRSQATITPNKRMHGAVYKTLGAMFFGILMIWAITFRNSPSVIFNLAICFIYLAMYLGGPVIFARAAGKGINGDIPLRKFLREPFDTYTGIMTGKEAWVQACLIPGALFICTVGMGVAVAIAN